MSLTMCKDSHFAEMGGRSPHLSFSVLMYVTSKFQCPLRSMLSMIHYVHEVSESFNQSLSPIDTYAFLNKDERERSLCTLEIIVQGKITRGGIAVSERHSYKTLGVGQLLWEEGECGQSIEEHWTDLCHHQQRANRAKYQPLASQRLCHPSWPRAKHQKDPLHPALLSSDPLCRFFSPHRFHAGIFFAA